MSFLVSPGVQVKEIDLTDIIPAQSTSIGGFAGYFRWGPVGELVTVGSEKELAQIFGAPTTSEPAFERSFLQAASFLKYGNALKVSRANAPEGAGALTAYAGSYDGGDSPMAPLELAISSLNDIETHFEDLQEHSVRVTARYPGYLGNSLKVWFVRSTNYDSVVDSGVRAALQFKPSTTSWAKNLSGNEDLNDEIAIVVTDADGDFSGTKWNNGAGTVLEVFEGLSIASNSKNEFGQSNYWVDRINASSSYILGVPYTEHTVDSVTNPLTNEGPGASGGWGASGLKLGENGGNGVDQDSFTNRSEVVTALELFADAETVDVNLLFAYVDKGITDFGAVDGAIEEIVTARKDCLGFISAPLSVADETSATTKKAAVVDKFSTAPSNSYLVFDSTPAYVYNKYRDAYAWISLSGHIAGLCARTDSITDPWFSPAGLNRGQLQGIVKLAYNPGQADRDDLYKKSINPVLTIPGQGTVLYGDRTALAKPSAFDRINVRRLFITIEKAIATAAKFQLFELNDVFTRSAFRNAIEPYLRDVQGRRGITDFRVVCDETNNTSQVIDGNRFVADIYVKPARSINYITLNFVATRSGASFTEIVGA